MRLVLAIFMYSMRVFLASLGSAVVIAAVSVLLFPGEIGDMAGIALLALVPCYFVVVGASAIEEHIAIRRQPRRRALRAVRIAAAFFSLCFLTLLVLFLISGTFSVVDWSDALFILALIAAAATVWGMTYWFIYTLSAPVFEIPPRDPPRPAGV